MSILDTLRRTVLSKMMMRSIVVLSVSIFLVEFLAYKQASEQIVKLTEERQRELTALYAERFDQIVGTIKIDMESIASLPSLRDYHLNRLYDLRAEARQQLGNVAGFLARLYERNRAYSEIEIRDKHDRPHLTLIDGKAVLHPVPPVDYFEQPLDLEQKAALSAGFVDEGILPATTETKTSLTYSYPLSVHGEPIGRVSIAYDFESLIADLKKQKIFETGHLAVLNRNGNVVYIPHLPLGERLAEKRPAFWRALDALGFDGTGRFETKDGHGNWISAAPMKAKPWVVVAVVPESEMFAELDKTRNIIIALVVLAILLELLAVYAFTRHLISKPMAELLEGTRAVHEGNLNHRVVVDTNDEFGQLAQSFNHMTNSLREGQDHLEQRVKERTQELEKEIEQRRQAERAMRKSEARFRDFTEVSADWVWEVGRDFKVSYVSERASRVLGPSIEKILGQEAHLGIDFSSGSMDRETFRQILKQRKPFRDFEYRYSHPNGQTRYLRVNGKPFFDASGDFMGYRGSGSDVTEKVRAKEEIQRAKREAEHANEAKSEFLAKMSHELRTPLNAVIGYSDAMRESIFGEIEVPQYREYLEYIHGSGSHLLGLINEILDLSKIEAGHVDLVPEAFDLYEFSVDAFGTLRPMADARNNELILNCDEEIGNIEADKARLNQILFNLLSNACKFTENGQVSLNIEADEEREEIAFKVSDTGIGIPANKMDSLFDEFTQVHPEMVRSYGGTGLGLSISRNLCRMMGGSIEVQSEYGKGSEFTVRMPRKAA